MLERIALHQTRLRTPGLGLDGKGIALGAKGLVLVPTMDRLVAMLAIYTKERSLEDLIPSLALRVVRSKLGLREIAVEFAAESSDRMDRMAETARLVGGFAFTGTSRHFVKYRDASAPFGYDAPELLVTESLFVLYHDVFTQAYEHDRDLPLQGLLLRLDVLVDPRSHGEPGPRWLVAEAGLGGALLHYLVRWRVAGDVGVAEWPPETAFDDGPRRRTLVRVPEVPPRMAKLFATTPGIRVFAPVAPGVAVEAGYRHPIELRACPVFDPEGLVLFRGKREAPLMLRKLPLLGAISAFSRVDLRPEGAAPAIVAERTLTPDAVRVPLRVMPSLAPVRNVTAAWVPSDRLALMRKLAYALPYELLRRATIAVTERGAFLRCPSGIEAIPLGLFFVEVHPDLHVPAGHEVAPAVAPEVLRTALALPEGRVVFLTPGGRAIHLAREDFVPLEKALLQAPPLDPLEAQALEEGLEGETIELQVVPLGPFALSQADPPPVDGVS